MWGTQHTATVCPVDPSNPIGLMNDGRPLDAGDGLFDICVQRLNVRNQRLQSASIAMDQSITHRSETAKAGHIEFPPHLVDGPRNQPRIG